MNEGQGGLVNGGIYSAPVQEYDDIVIKNSKPKKRWKKWVIFGVVAITVVVAIVTMIVLNSNYASRNNYKEDFSRFTNFVLYGVDSEKRIPGEYGEFAPYAIQNAVDIYSDSDMMAAYFEEMYNLYAKVVDNKLKIIEDEDMDSLTDGVNFLYAYSKVGVPTIDDLKEIFYENGDGLVLNKVLAKYEKFDGASSIVGEYAILLNTYINVALDAFRMDDVSSNDYLSAEYMYESMIDYVYSIAGSVAEECFNINNVVNGGKSEK